MPKHTFRKRKMTCGRNYGALSALRVMEIHFSSPLYLVGSFANTTLYGNGSSGGSSTRIVREGEKARPRQARQSDLRAMN